MFKCKLLTVCYVVAFGMLLKCWSLIILRWRKNGKKRTTVNEKIVNLIIVNQNKLICHDLKSASVFCVLQTLKISREEQSISYSYSVRAEECFDYISNCLVPDTVRIFHIVTSRVCLALVGDLWLVSYDCPLLES